MRGIWGILTWLMRDGEKEATTTAMDDGADVVMN